MKLTNHTDERGRVIGFVLGMSFEEYLKVDAMSGSKLMPIRRSPHSYRQLIDFPQPPSDEMTLGNVLHTAMLEPLKMAQIAVWGSSPEHFTEGGNIRPRNSKLWDSFQELHRGRTIVVKKDMEAIGATVKALYESPLARKYLCDEGPTEVSMFWVDPYDGRYWKGRPDKIISTKNTATLVDLKKTRACSSFRFGRQAYELGYHIKAALYASGFQILTQVRPAFKWIAAETSGARETAVYRATPDVMSLGGDQLMAMLQSLDACTKTNNWPTEQPEEQDLLLPEWAMNPDEVGLHTVGDFEEAEA